MTVEYHQEIPRDLNANIAWRKSIRAKAKSSETLQREILTKCSHDILYYINGWVMQYNPNSKDREVDPFISWPFQDEVIISIGHHIDIGKDLVIEKSREMGASWMCLMVMEWRWRFKPWQKFLCMSRDEKAVDASDPDSLFWKIDFIHSHLPIWMRPNMLRKKLFFLCRDNNSTLTGTSSTGKAGVGGRATAMFVDEFSQIEDDFDVLARTSDTTKCRIFNGTYTGVHNAMFQLRDDGDFDKVQMHWTQHPKKYPGAYRFNEEKGQIEVLDKTYEYPLDFKFQMTKKPSGGPFPGIRSPWYDEQCRRKKSERGVALDLDINPQGSMSQFFDALIIALLVANFARPAQWVGDVVMKGGVLSAFVDVGTQMDADLASTPHGKLKLWCHLVQGRPVTGKYCIGADLSAGTGATNSCISILNANTGEKAGEWADPNTQPKDLASIAIAICKLFCDEEGNGAMLAWEMLGPGVVFGRTVVDLGYTNIYHRRNDLEAFPGKQDERPGFFPSPEVKRLLLEEYRAALYGRFFLNRSELALKECLDFRYNSRGGVEHAQEQSGGNDPSGAKGNHGDRVIADALAWKLAKLQGRFSRREEEKQPGFLSLAWRHLWHRKKDKADQEEDL